MEKLLVSFFVCRLPLCAVFLSQFVFVFCLQRFSLHPGSGDPNPDPAEFTSFCWFLHLISLFLRLMTYWRFTLTSESTTTVKATRSESTKCRWVCWPFAAQQDTGPNNEEDKSSTQRLAIQRRGKASHFQPSTPSWEITGRGRTIIIVELQCASIAFCCTEESAVKLSRQQVQIHQIWMDLNWTIPAPLDGHYLRTIT